MKQTIKLSESKLRNMVREAVKQEIDRTINEVGKGPDFQRKLGALQARKVINADGETSDELFNNQSKEGGKIYDYAKNQRSYLGKDSDEWGNTVNPLYKEYTKGYHEYLNAHPEELSKRHNRLRELGYYNESIDRVIKESIKHIIREHEEDWFNEDDTAFIGRTAAYYEDDDDSMFVPEMWTYDNTPDSKDFAGDVFRLSEEGKSELNWWIRCQRFNEYQRKNAFNPNLKSPEEEFEYLVKNFAEEQIR